MAASPATSTRSAIACEQLEGRARQAIDLHYRERAGRDAIADALDMQPDGVKTLLRRTRQVLRECVERKIERPKRTLISVGRHANQSVPACTLVAERNQDACHERRQRKPRTRANRRPPRPADGSCADRSWSAAKRRPICRRAFSAQTAVEPARRQPVVVRRTLHWLRWFARRSRRCCWSASRCCSCRSARKSADSERPELLWPGQIAFGSSDESQLPSDARAASDESDGLAATWSRMSIPAVECLDSKRPWSTGELAAGGESATSCANGPCDLASAIGAGNRISKRTADAGRLIRRQQLRQCVAGDVRPLPVRRGAAGVVVWH